jgi:hypothetical protein
MDLNSVNVSGGAGTLTIRFSDNDFGPTTGNAFTSFGGTTTGSFTYDAFADATNSILGTDTPLGSLGAFGPGAFAGDVGLGAFPGTSPYALTQRVVITHAAAGDVTSFDARLTVREGAVPESGSTLALFGIAVLGIVGLRRRFGKRAS